MTQWSGKQRRWANPVAFSIPRWAQGRPRKFQQWGNPHPQGEEWAKETVCPTLSAGAVRYIHAYFFFHTNLIFARNSNLLLFELVSLSLPDADFVISRLSAISSAFICPGLSDHPGPDWRWRWPLFLFTGYLCARHCSTHLACISSFHPHQGFMRNVLLLCWKLSPSKIKTNLHLKLTLYRHLNKHLLILTSNSAICLAFSSQLDWSSLMTYTILLFLLCVQWHWAWNR